MDEKKKLNSAGFCAVLGLLVLLAGLGGYALLQGREPATEEVEVTDRVHQPAAERTPPTVPPVSAPARVTVPQAEEAAAPEPVPVIPVLPEQPVPTEGPSLIVYPVSGQIVAAFSADELQYSETMGDWRTHNGIDLEAEEGTNVLSASAGTVLAVEEDPLMGTTVRVEHTGGYCTTYSNLQPHPTVSAGDEVSAGQIIGAVGTTAVAECSQPPHLHFGVEKDGELLDPEQFLNP